MNFGQRAALAAIVATLFAAAQGCNQRASASPQPDVSRGIELRKAVLAAAGAGRGAQSEETGEAESSGWATLSGSFTYAGNPPKAAAIAVNKDTEVCGRHPLLDESIEVGSDGRMANVVVWLRSKVTANPDLAAQASAEVVLDNKDCRFEPHVVVMSTKQKLLIKNSDPVGHNSNGSTTNNPPFNPIVPAKESATVSLPKEESTPAKVGCNIHPWMGAWLVVRNDPYASVSAKDGSFTIKDLPAGKDLEFQLWQEKVGLLADVEVQGIKVDNKGRFKLKLTAGEDRKLEFKVNNLK